MKKNASRIAAFATVGALALVGFGTAEAAQADASQLLTGTITLLGVHNGQSQGSPITSGSASDPYMFYGIHVSAGCPAGWQSRSDTFVYQNNVKIGSLSTNRDASTQANGYGSTGLDGNPVSMSDVDNSGDPNVYVNSKPLSAVGTLAAGAFEIRYWCEASIAKAAAATDKYFSLTLYSKADGSWSTTDGGTTTPPTPTATTTALTGTLAANHTATLTATVAPAAATGTVDFYEGTTKLGTGTVTNGVASFTTAALADGSHSFTSTYVPATGANYSTSTSGAFSLAVTTAPTGGNQYDITVTIPTGTGSLTLGGYTRATVDLGTATLSGSSLTASGTLPGGLTVTDSRQVGASAWSLTGQDTDFATSDATKSFDGGYLGWVPVVGTGSQGTAGARVDPITGTSDTNTAHGLKAAARVLATGQVTAANTGSTVTAVGAQLNLAVPAQTPGGQYKSVLTLTLS